jgi:hypothetical protein
MQYDTGRKLKSRRARTQASGWALARRTTGKCCSLDKFKSPPTTEREMGGHTLSKTQIGILGGV